MKEQTEKCQAVQLKLLNGSCDEDVRTHLDGGCPDCRALADTLQMLDCVPRNTAEPPDSVDLFIKAAARQALKKPSSGSFRRMFLWVGSTAAMFVLISGVILFSLSGNAVPESDISAQTASASPVLVADWDWSEFSADLACFSNELNEAADQATTVSASDIDLAVAYYSGDAATTDLR